MPPARAPPPPPAKQRLDALVCGHAVIPRELLECEADLVTTKWPAYRFMSPFDATMLFAEEYRKAYRDCLRRNVDYEYAQRAEPLRKLDLTTNNKQLTQLWVARQHADRHFIPYGQYLEFCFDFATRRVRQALPRPNQLRPSSPEQTVAWDIEFERFWAVDRLVISLNRMLPMGQYAVSEGAGLPAQTNYRDALLALAQQDVGNLNGFVGTHVVSRRHIAPEDLTGLFGEDPVNAAIATAEFDIGLNLRKVHDYDELDKADRWQACCGVLGVKVADADQCRTCPQQETCTKLCSMVERELVKVHGSPDPLLDEKRRKNRDGVRRNRAKAAAAALVAA